MADTSGCGERTSKGHDKSGWVILGAVLVVVGFFLAARDLGLIPWPLIRAWEWFSKARVGLGLLLLGIALMVWGQSPRRAVAPRAGERKLMRSRDDKWIAGVLGGLARYFGVDSTLLRLAFIALVVLFDLGGLIAAYVIMAIVVPLEPEAVIPPPPEPVQPTRTPEASQQSSAPGSGQTDTPPSGTASAEAPEGGRRQGGSEPHVEGQR